MGRLWLLRRLYFFFFFFEVYSSAVVQSNCIVIGGTVVRQPVWGPCIGCTLCKWEMPSGATVRCHKCHCSAPCGCRKYYYTQSLFWRLYLYRAAKLIVITHRLIVLEIEDNASRQWKQDSRTLQKSKMRVIEVIHFRSALSSSQRTGQQLMSCRSVWVKHVWDVPEAKPLRALWTNRRISS